MHAYTLTHSHTPHTLLTHSPPTHPQTRDYVNEKLLSSFPIGKLDKCSGLCRPVSYETTHQWMLSCGCKYKKFEKTYYNDTHERHDNQLDRVKKAKRHGFVSFREEKWYCVSPAEKERLVEQYANWPSGDISQRIPKRDVGAFPPNGGTQTYLDAKESVDGLEDWYEYHTDFLPEELVMGLNSGRGGFVSQRRYVGMPRATPRTNKECIARLCDLLTVSCPQTELLLQKNIDRLVVGSRIRCVCVCVCVWVCGCVGVWVCGCVI